MDILDHYSFRSLDIRFIKPEDYWTTGSNDIWIITLSNHIRFTGPEPLEPPQTLDIKAEEAYRYSSQTKQPNICPLIKAHSQGIRAFR